MGVITNPVVALIYDGTNGPVTVKPASTAPVATDKAQVVVVSPNQQAIPITTIPVAATSGIAYGEITTAATAQTRVWKTAYNEPSSAAQRSLVSTSLLDTNSSGTGARRVKITYFDASGNGPFTEIVNLNGVLAVNTTNTNICFIEKLEVVSVGSGGSNAGLITFCAAAAGLGGTVGTIAIGDNRTLWAHHYVATGKNGYVTGMTGNNSTSNQSVFAVKAVSLPIGTNVEQVISDTLASNGPSPSQRSFGIPITVPGPARIVLYVTPGATASIISRGSFDFYEQ